jgi:hypothetical protein
MLQNAKPLLNSYTVNGVIYTRRTHGRGIAKKIIIVLAVAAFLFAYGLAGRADFCGMNPKAQECHNVK